MVRSSDLFMRKLVRHLVGYLPVDVPDEAGSRYEARIFKSGKAYIVSVYNRSKTEAMEFHIPLKIGAESDWDVIDFKRGSKECYTGTIDAELAAEEIRFYVLSPAGSIVFPEIGSGAGCTPLQWMQVIAEHPAVTGESFREKFKHRAEDPTFRHLFGKTELHKGDRFRSGFPDYIQIAPGAKGETLARSVLTKGEGGHTTLVGGEVGKGKVVLSGFDIGCLCEKRGEKWVGQEKCIEGEEKILANALYWLASE